MSNLEDLIQLSRSQLMMSQVQNPDRQAPRDGLTRNVPRFLGDGVDGAEDGDIDALFENLDDDDDMRLPPAVSTD